MHRRSFVLGTAAVVAMQSVLAQQASRRAKIGVILAAPIPNALMQAFEREMQALGYVNGRNVDLVYRSAEGNPGRFPAIAAELVEMRPDVIVTGGGGPATIAAQRATNTIPIVFPASADPVAEGIVQSLSRPGTNATGLAMLEQDMSAKRFEIVKQLVPRLDHLAVLVDPTMRHVNVSLDGMRRARQASGIRLTEIQAAGPEAFEAAFAEIAKARPQALLVAASSSYNAHRSRLIELAARHRLVAVWEHRLFTESGGLMSYGPNFEELYRGAARYVDRILKGAKPAEMPVAQATKLELVINVRTAKALKLKIPPALLARADHVIQ